MMADNSDFHQIQRRIAKLTTFKDGLWDLMLGGIFLLLAVYPVTRERFGPEANLALFLGVLALLVFAWFVLRYLISVPRIGHVESLSLIHI